jgi:Hemolysin-type calcium-binding repeat (2 copies).
MATITGSRNKDDILVGTSSADTISGLGGNDTL